MKIKKAPDRRNAVCTALGTRLKECRLAVEKSQEQLAFEAGLDRTHIGAVERGIANPTILVLANICYALGMSLADFFEPIKLALSPEQSANRRAKPATRRAKPKISRLR
jgi:transcriptional regulator with XRE-family HTH domain